jgi:hypothetical protein
MKRADVSVAEVIKIDDDEIGFERAQVGGA